MKIMSDCDLRLDCTSSHLGGTGDGISIFANVIDQVQFRLVG